MQGGPDRVGEARDVEVLAVEEDVSMECNEVQEEESDSYGNQNRCAFNTLY